LLPKPGWNLWENSRGIHAFTCAAVVAGLKAAGQFAHLFAEDVLAEKYHSAAESIVTAIASRLYSNTNGRFLRALVESGSGEFREDTTIDASLFGLFYFECFAPDDSRIMETMSAIEEKLSVGGGIARFENDDYMRADPSTIGNPWFISTLWLAEYYIARAIHLSDLERPLEILNWVAQAALPSGVLAEQLDPSTGAPLSVSPLTWSHSTFVAAVLSYLRKRREIESHTG
jgi:GH15 family glucan-1,4-alpha-glucosidase